MSRIKVFPPLLQGREHQLATITNALVNSGFAIVPDFLSLDESRNLATECIVYANRASFIAPASAVVRCWR